MNDLKIPHGSLALTAIAPNSGEDSMDAIVEREELLRIKEDLSKYRWFFHDFDEIGIILGKEVVSLTEFGERLIRDMSDEIPIGESSYKRIDCLRSIEEFIYVILALDDWFIYDFAHDMNHRYRAILSHIMEGDRFYDEVKLVFGKIEIGLMQLKKQPIHRGIEINGKPYLFDRVLRSIQRCLLEYQSAYYELYKDFNDLKREDELKRKREELRRKLMHGEDITIAKNEDGELPFQIDEREMVVPNNAESSENDDGEDTLRIPKERFGGSEDSINLLK